MQGDHLLQQSDTYPAGLRRVGTIKGLKYLLKKNELDFSFPTNQLLYGTGETIINKRPANPDGQAKPLTIDPIIYLTKPPIPSQPNNDQGGQPPPCNNNANNNHNNGGQPFQQDIQQEGPRNADNFFAGDDFEPVIDQDTDQRQLLIGRQDRGFPLPPLLSEINVPAIDTPTANDQLIQGEDEDDFFLSSVDNSMDKYWSRDNIEEIYRVFMTFNNTQWTQQFNDFVEWFTHPHTPFPNDNEVQIILQDSDREGLQFGDVIVNSEPTGENIFEAFQFIAERTDLQLMPISKFMGTTLTSFEAFIERYDLDNANYFGGDEQISHYLYCKYMITNFNLYYTNIGNVEDSLIFFRHPTEKTKIEETKNLIALDPTTSLIEIFQAFKEINNAGALSEKMQNGRFDDNRWTICYEKLSLFESVIGEQLNRLASLIYRNYTYRLIGEPFNGNRESYANILKKMLSKQNGNKFIWELNAPDNTSAFNEMISLAALFDCFVTSTAFPPSLNQLPKGMTRMITDNFNDGNSNFLAGAMLSIHGTENLFLASRLRNFMLMYTAILSGTYYFGFVNEKTGDFEKSSGNRPMVNIGLVLSGQRAMEEFTDNLNPANLLTTDRSSLSYNALSNFIDQIDQKAQYQADGDMLGITNSENAVGGVIESEVRPENTNLATLETNNMLMNNNTSNMVEIEDFNEDERINLNQVIPSFTYQEEDSDFSSHNSFISDNDGEFDDNFYDKNGRAVMNYQRDLIETEPQDTAIMLPIANTRQKVAQTLVPIQPLTIDKINTSAVNLNNTDLLHPSFADNKNNPAIENTTQLPAIEERGGGSNRRSDLRYSWGNTIASRGPRALSKQEKRLVKSTKRRRRGDMEAVNESNAFNQFAVFLY